MPSPMKVGDFERKCKCFGISIRQGAKSTHLVLSKQVLGIVVNYVAVVHHNKVDAVYVQKTRKTFKLTPKDGVSDRDWESA